MIATQKIRPCLWFDSEAEAAVNHYVAAFPDSRITHLERYGDAGPGPKGQVMVANFTLAGQQFKAINGGPLFKPSEATSLLITCDDQAEVDRLWVHLSEGGSTAQCGWLKDRWGFSWQVTPQRFFDMVRDGDPAQKARVFQAMMKMTKLDIAGLEKAYAGS